MGWRLPASRNASEGSRWNCLGPRPCFNSTNAWALCLVTLLVSAGLAWQSSGAAQGDYLHADEARPPSLLVQRRPLTPLICPPSAWESSGNRTYIPLMDLNDWKVTGQYLLCGPGISERVFNETTIPREELLAFTPCKLFGQIRGRTLWFFGDSQQDGFRRATTFFLRQYSAIPLDIVGTLIDVSGIPEILTDGHVPHVYLPRCVELIDNTRVCGITLMEGDRWRLPFLFEFLNRVFPTFSTDVVIFNYGLHYELVKSPLPRDLVNFAAYRAAIKTSGTWDMPLTIWIDTFPQHFSTPTGVFKRKSGLDNDTCRPFETDSIGNRGAYNALSDPYIANVSDLHLAIWGIASPFHYAHYKPGDCSHYCRPGVPELMVYQLYRLLSGTAFGQWRPSSTARN